MKNKEILKNYLYWFLTFIGCMLIGIIRTYAITFTDFTDVHSNTTLYVGYADSGNPISWPFNNSSLYQNNIISLDYVVNKQIVANTHYEFESHMLANRLIGTSIYSVVDASGNTCLTDSYYLNFLNGEYPRWDFQCSNNSSGFTIHIQQPNNSRLFNEGYMGWGSAILSKTSTPISSSGNDTQEIIDNANANANQIIDNQNQNTQDIINSNKVCETIDKSYIELDNKQLTGSGGELANNLSGVTKYINIQDATIEELTYNVEGYLNRFCFYDSTKTYISCEDNARINDITIPNNAVYFRSTIVKSSNKPTYKICRNGNQANNNAINGLNDTLNDDSIDTSDATDFFDNFSDNNHGLSGIITAPLTAINSMLNNQCSPLTATWKNKTISLDCGYSFWQRLTGFQQFLNIAIDGLLCYRILIKLFQLIEKLKNPNDDRVEVMDL